MAELDKIRTELLNRSAVILQRHARGFVARSKYQRQRQAVVTLQVSPRALQPHFLWHSHHAPKRALGYDACVAHNCHVFVGNNPTSVACFLHQ